MSQIIGKTFSGISLIPADGDEYLACTFIECTIQKPPAGARCKFYDCVFDRCTFIDFDPSEFGMKGEA